MNTETGRTFKNLPRSFWLASTDSTDYPSLNNDLSVNTAIIGGGMAGILCAWYLKAEGLDTAILEADRIVQGTTAHTTAKITSQHGLIYHKIEQQRGSDLARQYAEANEWAITEIKKISENNNIQCEYTPQSAYVYTQEDKNIRKVEDEVKTASSLGIKASYIHEIPFPIPIKAGIKFEKQAQFHPRKFLLPLAEKLCREGVKIYENSRVVSMDIHNPYTLTTNNGIRVTAENVIIASHYPFYNKHGMYYSRIYTERTYIIAIRAHDKYPGGMYINAEEPSRSLRYCKNDNDEMILVVGENHKTGQGKDMDRHYWALADFAEKIFSVKAIPYRWSTQDCMTLDGIPYVGQFSSDTPGLYIVAGFEKWGMTNSVASAIILKDLILRGESPWQEVYNPSRKNLTGSVKHFVVENLDVAKHLIGGKIVKKTEDEKVKSGEGNIAEVDRKRTGAYRDNNGNLHLVNTTCTHMGCELNWNSAELSWDCPCHGSRFTYTGEIVEGPAVHPLSKDNDISTINKIITEDF